MNLMGFLRVTFLSLNSPDMQLQSINSALGLLMPRQGESRKDVFYTADRIYGPWFCLVKLDHVSEGPYFQAILLSTGTQNC